MKYKLSKQLHFSSARQLWAIAHQYKEKNQKQLLGSREDFCLQIKYLKLEGQK